MFILFCFLIATRTICKHTGDKGKKREEPCFFEVSYDDKGDVCMYVRVGVFTRLFQATYNNRFGWVLMHSSSSIFRILQRIVW